MPSPTLSTVPVSVTSAALSKFWMFFLMIWLISSARSCMTFYLFAGARPALGAGGGVPA
ncbi:MAG TPA: hypothetical protein VFS43_37410 [Polyangiaceae bacterium]|nr:hypothetical protein [Polyangiaceae bacterium]